MRRIVDYLATRPEFDLDKLAYGGISWGGRIGVLNLAIEPYESAQIPLYRLLQLREGEKKHVVWDAVHATYPPDEARREVLAWLERFFGAPGR